MKVIYYLTALLMSANLAFAAPENESSFIGENPIAIEHSELSSSASNLNSKRRIREVLELESRAYTVGEAMRIKESGLVYVQDLSDFSYLAQTAISNPSEAYTNAVAEFIAQNVAGCVRDQWDLRYIPELEARTRLVGQAIRVKEAAMIAVRDIRDFLDILPFSVSNPSDAYKNSVGEFTATNASQVIDSYTSIYLIVDVERFTKTVGQAMRVKNAGLAAVRDRRDLYNLAEHAFANPSQAYIDAVERFIRENYYRYP